MRSLFLLPVRLLFVLPLRLLFVLPLRLLKKLRLIGFSLLAGMAIAYGLQLREAHRHWGLRAADVERALAGDDLVDEPSVVETRSLVIDAEPSAIWPWLVQMGHGRGGWYSYAQLERPWSPTDDGSGASADEILPEFQDLAVGDIVPTYPGGGFGARIVEPERALVLYLDDELVKEQVAVLEADGDKAGETSEEGFGASGIRMAGAMGDREMPRFKVSWAFILEPEAGGRTRLIERFRAASDDSRMSGPLGAHLVRYGIFAMTRRQMLGIKERVERAAGGAPGVGSEAA
jgi:hypothetical protein